MKGKWCIKLTTVNLMVLKLSVCISHLVIVFSITKVSLMLKNIFKYKKQLANNNIFNITKDWLWLINSQYT